MQLQQLQIISKLELKNISKKKKKFEDLLRSIPINHLSCTKQHHLLHRHLWSSKGSYKYTLKKLTFVLKVIRKKKKKRIEETYC